MQLQFAFVNFCAVVWGRAVLGGNDQLAGFFGGLGSVVVGVARCLPHFCISSIPLKDGAFVPNAGLQRTGIILEEEKTHL